MVGANLSQLDIWDARSGALNVIIETVKGSRNKLKYDPERQLFLLKKVLPKGAVFPFDFGFIPSTLGEDGDPLDVLILMDESTTPGCLIASRLIGVIEAEQTEDGATIRNDRLIAVAEHSHEHESIRSLRELHDHLAQAIEHFFISYNEMDGKRFRPLGHFGPNRANKLVQKGAKRFSKQHQKEPATGNGRPKVAAK